LGADLLGVEVEPYRAGEAVVVAVPGETAGVDLVLTGGDLTRAVVQSVPLVTGLADALG
jgi:hypothetical protein